MTTPDRPWRFNLGEEVMLLSREAATVIARCEYQGGRRTYLARTIRRGALLRVWMDEDEILPIERAAETPPADADATFSR